MTDYEKPTITPEEEQKLLSMYEALKGLARSPVPAVSCNCRMALAYLWQVVNDLGLRYEHLELEELP